MNVTKSCLLAALCLDVTIPALAATPTPGTPVEASAQAPGTGTTSRLSAPERWAKRCRHQASTERTFWPNGGGLQGMLTFSPNADALQASPAKEERGEPSSIVASIALDGAVRPGETLTAAASAQKGRVKLEGGHLMWADGASSPVGSVLQGSAGNGKPVEVAVCEAEPAKDDPDMIWYRIEYWNEATEEWTNPCAPTAKVPSPRALAVSGVWDAKGAHSEAPGKFTWACETGAIAKCAAGWKYKPWQTQGGQSMAEYHQACTRAARADYCGNGKSHTKSGVLIDIYDRAGFVAPDADAPMPLEAAWTANGAQCLAHTRDGRALEEIQKECPERWEKVAQDLGNGDRCVWRQKGVSPAAVRVLNRSNKPGEKLATQTAAR